MPDTDAPAAVKAEFSIERVFDAPRDLVWQAWSDPALLAQWFGPKGTTTTVITHDLRPGGFLHARMESPGGLIWAKLAYRDIAAPARLVWVHSFSDEHANVVRAPFFDGLWPLELLTTVTFEEHGAQTRMRLTWQPIDASPDERRTFAAQVPSMNQGWSGSFDQLDLLLTKFAARRSG